MLDLKVTTEVHKSLRRLLQNRDWLRSNFTQVQAEYGEKWVAIADMKIVAHATTAGEVKERTKGKYPEKEIIIALIPRGEVSRLI